MSRLAILVLCIQACLIQTALSQQCPCNQISYGYAPAAPCVGAVSANANAPSLSLAQAYGSYGGSGMGQVGVTGDIDASGQTCVVGSVPVLGQVDFSGTVPAAGSVSISGQCGCGCQ